MSDFDGLIKVASVATQESSGSDDEIRRILEQMDPDTLGLLPVAVKIMQHEPWWLFVGPRTVAHCRAFAKHVGAAVKVSRVPGEGFLAVDFYPPSAH
jgi:hypothetical protein